jgi:hypothetical protein
MDERHKGLVPKPQEAGWAEFLMLYTLTTNTLHPLAMSLVHPYRPGGEESKAATTRQR